MGGAYTLRALIRKRAEMAATQDQLRQLIIDLDHIDATIRLLDPAIDLEEIKPKPLPPKHHAYKSEVTRAILEALRISPRPMTARELAQHVMAQRGINIADKALVKTMGKRVGASM